MHLRGLLDLVGLALFLGNLPVGLRFHQFRRRIDVADQGVDGLHIVSRKSLADVAGGLHLSLAARAQEIEDGVILG